MTKCFQACEWCQSLPADNMVKFVKMKRYARKINEKVTCVKEQNVQRYIMNWR